MTRRSAARHPAITAALAAALLAVGLASCRDAATAPGPQPSAQAAVGVRRDVGAGPTIDPGFDPNDTQVEVEMYVDRVYDTPLDSTIDDPLTGAPTTSLHVEASPEHLLVRGGYDAAGFPRFAVTNLGVQDGTGEGLGMVTIGGPNDVTVYGTDGAPLDATSQLGDSKGANPLGLLGLDQTTDITAGLVGGDPTAGAAPAAGARAVAPGTLQTLQTRTLLVGGSMTRTFRRGPDGVARLSVVEVTDERPASRPGAQPARSLTRQRYVRVEVRAIPARDAARAARAARAGRPEGGRVPPRDGARTRRRTERFGA